MCRSRSERKNDRVAFTFKEQISGTERSLVRYGGVRIVNVGTLIVGGKRKRRLEQEKIA